MNAPRNAVTLRHVPAAHSQCAAGTPATGCPPRTWKRGGGFDPGRRSWWKRRLSHNADVVDLASKGVTASFSVSPLHMTLSLSDGHRYEWRADSLLLTFGLYLFVSGRAG